MSRGRLYQLRRGLYALAPPFQKVCPHPFVVANRLVRGSYVSLQSALAFHGGTALRFLHSIRRYSEDLDFALERPGRATTFAVT